MHHSIPELHLDFETYSEVDLKRAGAYAYARHPSTEITLATWATGSRGDLVTWELGDRDPRELEDYIADDYEIIAHNAQFEYAILKYVATRQWRSKWYAPRIRQMNCTAARAAMCSLPRHLAGVGEALELRWRKNPRGTALMTTFCKPRKPTKNNPATRIYPEDRPEDWAEFRDYNIRDVESEREAHDILPPLPEFERKVFMLDFKINERGIPIDVPLVRKASSVVKHLEANIKREVRKASSGINPTQRDKLLAWLAEQGLELDNLQAKTVAAILKRANVEPHLRRVLELRVEGSKASTKKLDAMLRVTDPNDGRARGTQLYYGAHTGRQAGRLIQPHNYMRGTLKTAEQRAIYQMIRDYYTEPWRFEDEFNRPISQIAQCMRGFIRPEEGKVFWIADYASIEVRVLAWLADDRDMLRDYMHGLDPYIAMAVRMYGCSYAEIAAGVKAHDARYVEMRRVAKSAVLGCGYGLGAAKFIDYCANNDVIIDDELAELAVRTYREIRKAVVRYWGDVERAAIEAVRRPGKRVHLRNISFFCNVDGYQFLTIRLPSGRDLYYPKPRLTNTQRFGRPAVVLGYKGSYFGKWVTKDTYGGRLVENIVQAVARDIMAQGMLNVEDEGYPVILTVHDEVIAEEEYGDINPYIELLCRLEPWAEGCPIAAEGFLASWYRKG